ncbi:SpoIIE family protein phosphatase [Streptomyces sp. NPDC052415]|uniref:SpoIIE family protein phosphatase n=1 Tax=Streptomyces sp. NPDC052415 TaxID=3365690 RepID=UPI0037D7743E
MHAVRGGRQDPLASVAVAVTDHRGVVVAWSDAAEELLELPAPQMHGRSVLRLLADDGRRTAGSVESGSAVEGTTRLSSPSGHAVTVRYRTYRLADAGYVIAAVPLERACEIEQAEGLMRGLLAQGAIGFILRDTNLTVARTNITPGRFTGPTLRTGSRLADVMSSQDATLAEAALRRVLETGEPLAASEQHVRSLQSPSGEWTFAVSAVRTQDADGQPTGVATLLTDATQHWRAAHRRELRHRASADVGGTLDVIRTAQEVVDVLVPAFGDLAWVDLAEAVLTGDEPPKMFGGGDQHLRRVAVRAAAGTWPSALLQPGAVVPHYPDLPVVRQLQKGRTIVVDRDSAKQALDDPAVFRLAVPEGGHSLALAPLFARGLVLGIVAIWRTSRPQPFDEEDADLLTEIAAHSALGVDNARRYTREHNAASALQRKLLPHASTRTSTIETTGSYVPAADGAEIGGDWFDAIKLPSLRTALVVGDVTGHGLHASATMGRLRTAVQTLADLELPPDELLARLDDLVVRLAAETESDERDAVGATCLVAVHDPVTGQCTLATAGHPPPIVIRPEGHARLVDLRPGPPLGVGGLPFEETTIDVPSGSILALYSDGLLQGAETDIDTAMHDLTDRLSRLQRSGRSLPTIGRDLLTELTASDRRDDTALLLARTCALEPGAVAHWVFPADPAAVADARDATIRKLDEWGLDDQAFATELIVSELVTNAVRYGGEPVGLRLIYDDDVLICEVSDPSSTQPRMRRARTTDEGGRGLFLVAQLSHRWGSRYGTSGKTIWVEQQMPQTSGPTGVFR